MVGNSGSRLRYVVLVGIGATFVLAHVAFAVSPWGPWGVAIGVAAVCGAVVAEGNNGAGVGGLTAGGGGFLFVFGELMDGPATEGVPLVDALLHSIINGINMFAMFGLVGMISGGMAGLMAARARRAAGFDDLADGEDDATTGDDDDAATDDAEGESSSADRTA